MGTSKKEYTCEDLTKEWKAAERRQFMGYMLNNFMVCSLRFDVGNKIIDVDVSVKPVDLLDEFQVLKLYHCNGLLLCVAKDLSRLVVCNPFLGQTRMIPPRASFHLHDKYAIGYDRNRNHKILRFMDDGVEANAHMLDINHCTYLGSLDIKTNRKTCLYLIEKKMGTSKKEYTWEDLTKDWNAAETQQFMGYMLNNSKVCSVSFDVRKKNVDVSVKPVDLLDEIQLVSKLYHCDGLLLCVARDLSRLVVCNPFLGQTRTITPRANFHKKDRYALGYDIYCKHKILRFLDYSDMHESEIYDFSTGSWKVLKPTLDCHIESHQLGVSLKGFTYFYSKKLVGDPRCRPSVKDFMVSFDFTLEKFGRHMCLPFKSSYKDKVTLSCVRQKQLVMLHCNSKSPAMDVWVTTRIVPHRVTWSKFFTVDSNPLRSACFYFESFFIDEKEKVVVVFGTDQLRGARRHYNTAYVLGERGFSKPTRLGGFLRTDSLNDCIPLVCFCLFSISCARHSKRQRR